jgi:hypothetical protein
MTSGAWKTLSVRARVLLVVSALCPLLVLWQFVGAGPVSDDFYFATRAFSLRPDTLISGTEWRHPLTLAVSGYRPIVLATYELSRLLGGGEMWAYRAVNYGLHALVTLLVGLLALRLRGSPAVAAIAALAFGLHPIHHENVVWISGRTHTLAAIFYFGCLLHLLWARDRRRTIGSAVAIASWTAAALACYEGAVTLPLAAFLLLASTAAGTSEHGIRHRWKDAAILAAPVIAVTAAYFVMRWMWVSPLDSDLTGVSARSVLHNAMGLGARLLAMPRLDKAILPWSWPFLISLVVATVTIAHGLWRAHTRPVVALGLALLVIGYLPFVALSGYSDRFAYIASAWFVIAMAAGAGSFWPIRSAGARMSQVVVSVLLAAACLTWAVQLRAAGKQWWEAGQIARGILDQTRTIAPDPPVGARLRFLCVPSLHGTALVFITYLEQAVQDAYGRLDLQPERVMATDPRAFLLTAAPAAWTFYWNGQTRTLSVVDAQRPAAWPLACHNPIVPKP